LDEVSNLATKLTPEGKSALARLIAAATPTINQMCDKVLATPAAGDIAKPTIDELRGRLDALSRA
jgi:DNA-binding transcriptional regulator YdaS (Cro superfamily)